MKKHSHTLITLAAVCAAFFVGLHWHVALAMAAFWAGREHSQAEYRWLALHKANRSRMPWVAGFLPESWNKDSLLNDLLIPSLAGLALAYIIELVAA